MINKIKSFFNNKLSDTSFLKENNNKENNNKENNNTIESQDLKGLDKFLENEETITDEEAAKILGFFLKISRDKGFPWDIKAKINNKFEDINELEALKLLKNNQEIGLFPKRTKIFNLADRGQELTTIGNISNLENFKKIGEGIQQGNNLIKNTELKSEVIDGQPIFIRNYKELKLLYSLFSDNNYPLKNEKLNELIQTLKPFILEKYSSKYFWKFYDPKGNNIKTKLKNALKNISKGGLIGTGVSVAFSSPLLLIGSLLAGMGLPSIGIALLALAGAGFVGGSLWGTKKSLKEANLGKELGPIETLKYLLENKSFIIQQKTINQFNIPFLGQTTWESNYKKPININNLDNLKTLKNIYY